MEKILFVENVPVDGESYAIWTDGDRYAFAWGPEHPYNGQLQGSDVLDGESGYEWFESESSAIHVMNEALEVNGLEKYSGNASRP